MNLPAIATQNASVAELYRSNADILISWERYNGAKDGTGVPIGSSTHNDSLSQLKSVILSSTRALTFYADAAATNDRKVSLIDISGTQPIVLSTLLVSAPSAQSGPIGALDSRFAAVIYLNVTAKGRVIDTNSDVLSLVGSEQSLGGLASASTTVDGDLDTLNSTQLIHSFANGAEFLQAVVIDVNTGTGGMTVNTPTVLRSVLGETSAGTNVTVYDTGKFFANYSTDFETTQTFGTVSGTTVTASGSFNTIRVFNTAPPAFKAIDAVNGWVNDAQDSTWCTGLVRGAGATGSVEVGVSLGQIASLSGASQSIPSGSTFPGSAPRVLKMEDVSGDTYMLVAARPSDLRVLSPNALILRGGRFNASTREFSLSPRTHDTGELLNSSLSFGKDSFHMVAISETKALITYSDSTTAIKLYIANL